MTAAAAAAVLYWLLKLEPPTGLLDQPPWLPGLLLLLL
jgi:hypothetical protein